MTKIKTLFGLGAAAVAVVGVVAFGAGQASASSAPIVITYTKTCDSAGTCTGTTGDGRELKMQITGFRGTGRAAQVTFTEWIIGGTSITAELNGHASPAGFIVLNGTVTDGSFAGAQVHQRSDFAGVDGDKTVWTGELRLMRASA
jgi:hypothetical protein